MPAHHQTGDGALVRRTMRTVCTVRTTRTMRTMVVRMSQNAADLFVRLREIGCEIWSEGGVFWVRPPAGVSLTDAERDAIRGQREQLLDLLWAEDVASAGRVLGWPQDSAAWDGGGFRQVVGGVNPTEKECS